MRQLVFLLILQVYAFPLLAAPQESLVPGGIAIIDLDGQQSTFEFKGKPVLVTTIDGKLKAIVGLSLGLKAGEHFIRSKNASAVQKKFFLVKPKKYTLQKITIKDKRKVNPYASDMDRILAEKSRKQKARRKYSHQQVDINFIVPVEGINTGAFGRRRIFNGQARKPHSGMDIAAPTGTLILAPSAGTVVELGDFFFSGNLVYLDHGQGMISLFAHMDKIEVTLGQKVQKGEVVGTVGETGRVTGPHLHWSLGLNGNWINPELFLPEKK